MAKNITKVPDGPLIKKKGPFKGSTLKNGGPIKKAQLGTLVKKGAKAVGLGTAAAAGASSASSCSSGRCFHKRGGWTSGGRSPWRKNGGTVKKAKAGAMIKRADGSTSQRGLWDNIRKNKGSGKKPTAAMLKQEKKIKAKSKK